ncbi:phosphoglycerate dehydrogenase [Streptacidiphilus pinicola]|uniref:Phosphoglycerate dehydrogenase n=2 Tax=Streptacidiphilus pinicola TaxID=2219663 RepID=A0A2X0IE63_9ACTN|nr:phosphoglycerate dehydrogenase [Streptacidiphilus pinicola]
MPDATGYPRLAELVRGCPDGDRVELFAERARTERELADRIRGSADVLQFFHGTPLRAEALLAARPARVLVAGPAGGAVDLDAARSAGIHVYDTPGLAAATVAEFTLTLLLALARRLPAGVGAGTAWRPTAGRDLAGRLLGVVGWGAIGSAVARLALGIGMRVAAWSPSLDAATAHTAGVQRLELDELLAAADAVSLHLRSAPGTDGIVDARRLALLGPHALLVNTARAALVDMAELRRRLTAGALGGVALDVFDVEPLPEDDLLRTHPAALLTPHMAWMTDDAVGRFLAAAIAFGVHGDDSRVRRLA